MPERSRPTFSRQPLLILAVCFGVGVLIAKFVAIISFWPFAVSCLVSAVLAFVFRKISIATIFVALAFIAVGAFAFECEKLRDNVGERIRVLYNGQLISGEPVEIEGVLAGRPEPALDGVFLILKTESLRHREQQFVVSGNVRIFVPDISNPNFRSEITALEDEPSVGRKSTSRSDPKYGSRIRVACRLEREDEFRNPGVQSRREILDRQNIDATASIKSAALIEHLADESVFRPLAWVYNQRASLIEDFRQNLSPRAAGVMIASLLGNKYFLDKETADLFRDGGTFHILVISGLHITFIGGLLLLFLRKLTRNRWLQFLIVDGVLWAYTLAVGADVPVVRASMMFTIILLGYAIYRRGSLLNSLGLCALVLLAWRPSELFDPSFQLTFVSVCAIVGLAYPLIEQMRKIGSWTPTPDEPFPPNVSQWLRKFCESVYWRPEVWEIESKRNIWTGKLIKTRSLSTRIGEIGQRILRYIFEGIIVSLIVQVCMLPLTIFYFHRVSLASVLLNLWIGFFIAIESFAAVAAALLSGVSDIMATPIFLVAEAANWLMLLLPRSLAGWNGVSFRLPAYTGNGRVIYVLFFATVIVLAIFLSRWRPFELSRPAKLFPKNLLPATSIVLLILLLAMVFHPLSAPKADGRLHIDFLDVGQGDSALVTFPNGQTLLVDGGGRFDYRKKNDETESVEPDTRGIGEMVVSEVLWAKGYSRIDHILATHGDADHIEGLGDVARNFSIGSAMVGRMPADDKDFVEFANVLKRRGIPIEVVSRGDVLTFGDVRVEVLYPTKDEDERAASDNDNSVVLRIVYGSRSFLLTGDIEQIAESELTNKGGTLRADVVKVAHHGSRTSSTDAFIAAAKPQLAVISVGRRSQFGHPHAEVVMRWQQSGASVFTTGENGMISVSTDGKDLTISGFVAE